MKEFDKPLQTSPFIKLLRSPHSGYFYDVNRNEIIPIDDDVYTYLDKLLKDGTEDGAEATLEKVAELKENGYLSNNRVKEIKHPNCDSLEEYLYGNLTKLCLQITQNCNLRCSYCVYSGSDDIKQRVHANKIMSFDTAKKAIEFYAKHSMYSSNASIAFYGGEPLLEFNLIKDIVKFSEKLFFGKQLQFDLTTNATLLTDEMVSYFDKHNITCMISLDGPKKIHDKNRKFANNSQGSFDKLYTNMEFIVKNYPDYFNKLSASMVLDAENDFEEINSIFSKDSIFNKINIQPSLIDYTFIDEPSMKPKKIFEKLSYHDFLAILTCFDRCNTDDVSPVSYRNIENINRSIEDMNNSSLLSNISAPGGPCIAGYTRLFCNVEGVLYPCERVSEKTECMKIGTIDSGFDLDKIKALMNVAHITKEQCMNCWAFTHCTQCAKTADNGYDLDYNIRLKNCNDVKVSTLYKFSTMILLDEVKQLYKNQIIQKEGNDFFELIK